MFTGIITDIGTVTAREVQGENVAFRIATAYDTTTIALGASIACDGICLTVTICGSDWFGVTASPETLTLTTAANWQPGRSLNLERSLKLGDELGGHLVSGHVDGIGQIQSIRDEGGSWLFEISAPETLLPLIAQKGSIAVDGISLTVNAVNNRTFRLMIIPHSWEYTTLSTKQPGDAVNLEIDMLARYIARQMHWNS
jgi:riboflavin synthase